VRILGVCLLTAFLANAQAIRRDAAFNAESVPRNDDGSSSSVSLGFTLNFFGKLRNNAYVNNNGNITFDAPLSTFTPFGLTATSREIIAPFFADVDTRNTLSNLVRYGRTQINGRPAFGANYIDVGYFSSHADKLNRFQVILIERSDTGEGNFDIEFNYERIAWETGDASGGTGGFGGVPAVVGYSNGTGNPETFFELAGSAISTQFLDTGRRALIRQKQNSDVSGRMVFRGRQGKILPDLTITTGVVLPEGTVGRPYRATLSSVGGSAPYNWTLTPDTIMIAGLTLDPATGVISGTPTEAGTASFTIGLRARTEDGDRETARRSAITILAPRIEITTGCPLPSAALNRSYSTRFTAAGGTGGYRWEIDDTASLPAGLSFSPDGTVSGTPQREGTYGFTVRANSSANDRAVPAERYCRLNVQPASVSINAACNLLPGTTGVPFAQNLQVDGGSAPFTFRLLGQLPLGLTLNANGSISGTPTVAGNFGFSVEVRDARAVSQTASCSFVVNEPELTVQGCPLPLASVGTSFSRGIRATGGVGPYTWSSIGTLPAGVILTPDGMITGTPRQSGGFLFRLIASDSEGRQIASPCSLSVLPTPLAASYCVLPEATEAVPYTQTVNARGGEAPHIFRVTGELPEGVSLSASGIANGVPSKAGEYLFGVNITDARGFSTSQSCSMMVRPQPMRLQSGCPLPSAKLGAAYTERLSAVGGQAPHTFTVQGGLPPGIAMTREGVFSGTPESLTQRSFAVEVRDAAGATTRQVCSLAVELPAQPRIRVAGVPETIGAASTSLAPVVELSNAYSLPIQGTLTLSAVPETASVEADANQPDPRVRFQNGFTSIPFTIPAGTRSVRLPLVTTGTVASLLEFRAENLRVQGADLNGISTPAATRIPAAAATLSEACYLKNSAGGYEMVLTGFSNTRELDMAFVTGATSQLQRVDVSGYSADYFASPLSIRAGGAFRVTFPFNLAAGARTVNVSVQNSFGQSQIRQAQQCAGR
jgi:hypothetical protein